MAHRIEIPERFQYGVDAHVLIRPKQSWSALNRVQAAGLVVRTRVSGEAAGEVTADVLARGLAVLETSVLSWSGVVDADGKPIPATRAGYLHDDLDPEFGDWLVDAITVYYESLRRPADDSGKAEAPPSPTL